MKKYLEYQIRCLLAKPISADGWIEITYILHRDGARRWVDIGPTSTNVRPMSTRRLVRVCLSRGLTWQWQAGQGYTGTGLEGHVSRYESSWGRRGGGGGASGVGFPIRRLSLSGYGHVSRGAVLTDESSVGVQGASRRIPLDFSVNHVTSWDTPAPHIAFRRLGAKGSYLPLWRVSDRIL